MASVFQSNEKEHRISVSVSGWPGDMKTKFSNLAGDLTGVKNIQSAGGSTSFYVYYDQSITSESELEIGLSRIVDSLEIFEKPHFAKTKDATFSSPDIVDPKVASSWTGIKSLEERVFALKQLAPIALSAVDSLVVQLQTPGGNGGPPLAEREDAIKALQQLHQELGALLTVAEKPNFAWADGKGLAASCVEYAVQAADALKDDPIPFAASGLLLTVFAAIGFPGVGNWLSGAAISFRKNGK